MIAIQTWYKMWNGNQQSMVERKNQNLDYNMLFTENS